MLIDHLLAALPDTTIKQNWPLSSLCTLRAGGEAEIFIEPSSIEDTRIAYDLAVKKGGGCPIYILGGGSNVLFPDGLIHGVVISTLKLNKIEWRTPLTADIDAGFRVPALMRELHERRLAGMEFMAGIPGTLGGAVAGNAGAGGRGICELADEIVAIEHDGSIRTWISNELDYGYRRCALSDGTRLIISARMTFRAAKPKDKEVLESYLLRRGSQPHGMSNAGCTFKNPEGNSAGKLLDECGCKGLFVGDAYVSDQHANFIVNHGNASASDIIELVKICARKVFDRTGIKLEPEIKIFAPGFSVL